MLSYMENLKQKKKYGYPRIVNVAQGQRDIQRIM